MDEIKHSVLNPPCEFKCLDSAEKNLVQSMKERPGTMMCAVPTCRQEVQTEQYVQCVTTTCDIKRPSDRPTVHVLPVACCSSECMELWTKGPWNVWKTKRKPAKLIRTCSFCDKSEGGEKFKRCGKCHNVKYCGKVCQKKHWKFHKPYCFENTKQKIRCVRDDNNNKR